MKTIYLTHYKNALFNLKIMNDNEFIGRLTFYPDVYEGQAWLHIHIDEKWRGKWLTMAFAKFLYATSIQTCQEYKLKLIWTSLHNPKSLRLLDFFGFIAYNEIDYYLKIE